MTAFEFDQPRTPGSNRAATGCPTCDGHGLVEVPTEDGREVYGRCPSCNVAPSQDREPVAEDAWWKQ